MKVEDESFAAELIHRAMRPFAFSSRSAFVCFQILFLNVFEFLQGAHEAHSCTVPFKVSATIEHLLRAVDACSTTDEIKDHAVERQHEPKEDFGPGGLSKY